MTDRDNTPKGGVQHRAESPPPPPWDSGLPDTGHRMQPVPPHNERPSWPATNNMRKVFVGVLVLLIGSGIGGAVLTYTQSVSNGEQIQEVRDRQDRHEIRGHSGTAQEIAETREDVSDVKGDLKGLKARIESIETNAEETREDVRWIRRRMGGGGG